MMNVNIGKYVFIIFACYQIDFFTYSIKLAKMVYNIVW